MMKILNEFIYINRFNNIYNNILFISYYLIKIIKIIKEEFIQILVKLVLVNLIFALQ